MPIVVLMRGRTARCQRIIGRPSGPGCSRRSPFQTPDISMVACHKYYKAVCCDPVRSTSHRPVAPLPQLPIGRFGYAAWGRLYRKSTLPPYGSNWPDRPSSVLPCQLISLSSLCSLINGHRYGFCGRNS